MTFSFVIPNFNGRKWLSSCLDSILEQEVTINEEIIVVDNGSTDDSLELVEDFQAKAKISIHLIKNQFNLGFAKAVNQGIKKAKNEWVVVLNNDLVLGSSWVKEMKKAIRKWRRKAQISTFCGRVLTADGKKIEGVSLRFLPIGRALNLGHGQLNRPNLFFQEEFVFGSSAVATVFLKRALFRIGLFDSNFFAYQEDVDLALRLQDAGWKTRYIPSAISYHLGGATSQGMGHLRRQMDVCNWWLIIVKNYPLNFFIVHSPGIFLERLRNLSGLLKEASFLELPRELFLILKLLLVKVPKTLRKRKPLKTFFGMQI